MSKDSAKKFVQAIIDDEELRKRTAAMKPEEAIPFAKEMGYDFTIEELTEVKTEDIELSPDDLENVAGGTIQTQGDMERDSRKRKERLEEDLYCWAKINGRLRQYGPLHNYVKVGHREDPFLGGIFEGGLFGWSTGYDVYECTNCKAIKSVKV